MKKKEIPTKYSSVNKTDSELFNNNVEKVCKIAFKNVRKTINSTNAITFCYKYNPNCPIYEPSINITNEIEHFRHYASKIANSYYDNYLRHTLVPESVANACDELKIDPQSNLYERVRNKAIRQTIKPTKKIVRKKVAKDVELHAFDTAICEALYYVIRAHNLDTPTEDLIYIALREMIVYFSDIDENDDEIIRKNIDLDKLPSMLQSIADRLINDFKKCD